MTRNPTLTRAFLLGTLAWLTWSCASSSTLDLGLGYETSSERILIELSRPLGDGETLFTQLRRGQVGALRCGRDAPSMARASDEPAGSNFYYGPTASKDVFEPMYDERWLSMPEPTDDMLAEIASGRAIVDVCLMSGDTIVAQREFDALQALDRTGVDGKADGEGSQIASPSAYASLCVEKLGEIPFFRKLSEDNDYETFNCLDAIPIPTRVTGAEGEVTLPTETSSVCDNPQYIYSSCEPNAVTGVSNGPRVISATNEEGSEFVLLCRKAKEEEGSYNDIAMIGHNPITGETCFFQNALYSNTDGLHVPHPADDVDSPESPQTSSSLWAGIHGGLGSGIQCADCHDSDAFIHTPWVDGALKADGTPVVPKMGVHENFALGFNDAPYSLVNGEAQGWTMHKHLVSPEAAACTKCHRIGAGRWASDWNKRLFGEERVWENLLTESHQTFEAMTWMPPDLQNVREETWPESAFAKAAAFIESCATEPEGCEWAELPTQSVLGSEALPEIDLVGLALAKSAAKTLGASFDDESCEDGKCGSRRCAECHSVSKGALRRWQELSEDAWSDCELDGDYDALTSKEALERVRCLRLDPSDDDSAFAASKLGVITTGVSYEGLHQLFKQAFDSDSWLRIFIAFKARLSMPKGNHPKLSAEEYATVRKWFRSDLESIDEFMIDPTAPTECESSRDAPWVTSHLEEMQFDSWAALNEEAGIRMYGCSGDEASDCFRASAYPNKTSDWGNASGTVRLLRDLDFNTSYWTRSSADGRYVGNGGGTDSRSTITDLMSGTDIGVDALYDPGFFPDNSGFVFQGAGGGAGFCRQSVLEEYDHVTFNEPECSVDSNINLYQHVARGINGGDYFVINSQFTSDGGRGSQDPAAYFDADSTMKFTPMAFDGSTYSALPPVIVESPFEGDSVLSPSARLVASRLASAEGRSLGYVVRSVRTERFSSGYVVNIDREVARFCGPGAKVSFSFDERFMVTHHYHDDRADLILYDLQSGAQTQITDMPEDVKALFPHFRSDGWIYFLVNGPEGESIAASDAALRLMQNL